MIICETTDSGLTSDSSMLNIIVQSRGIIAISSTVVKYVKDRTLLLYELLPKSSTASEQIKLDAYKKYISGLNWNIENTEIKIGDYLCDRNSATQGTLGSYSRGVLYCKINPEQEAGKYNISMKAG